MKKKIIAIVGSLLVAGLIFSGCGHRPHFGGDSSPRAMFSIMKKLDLTSEQKDSFRELKQEHFKIKQDIKDITPYITSTTFDADGIKKLMASKSEEKINLRVDFMQKAYNILNIKQREILLSELNKLASEKETK